MNKAHKTMVISWALWFLGIFATFLVGSAKANLDAGVIPPLSPADLVNALWAAIGAAMAVGFQYLNKHYTRYGVNAANADTVLTEEAPATLASDQPQE